MTGSSTRNAYGSRRLASRLPAAMVVGVFAWGAGGEVPRADGPVLKLRAMPTASGSGSAVLTIELTRWSTDAERSPMVATLTAPSAPVAAPAVVAPAGRGAGRAGRGGRGGREAAPPPSPAARLTAAVKAAPTLGYIWGDGPTGYSIKYAWRAATDGGERIVLATDRVMGAHVLPLGEAPEASADADFTVVELRLDASGRGEGKTSLAKPVVVDGAAKTLALDAYASAPVQLKVTRN